MSPVKKMIERAKTFQKNHERWLPLAFFVAGFCFDALMLTRIDELFALVQQAVYLTAAAALIAANLVGYQPRAGRLRSAWHYHEELLHFLLGTLLNAYTIFYFKASSVFTSIVFVLVLCCLLYVNESKRIRQSKAEIRFVLFSLCLTSYLLCLVPIVLGFIGAGPFLLSILLACGAAYPLYRFLRRRGLDKRMRLPFVGTQAAFVALYFAQLIPPVPLALNSMGIYHDLTKRDGEYILSYSRPVWKFWQNGDQTFLARPGDKIYFFAQIFSPGNFSERLNVRWLHKEPQGWHAWDAIPLPITGGREEGFRGYAVKANYEPGDWRVQVETHDGRELGRIYFTVKADESSEPRIMRVDAR